MIIPKATFVFVSTTQSHDWQISTARVQVQAKEQCGPTNKPVGALMAWPHALLRFLGLKFLWKYKFSISTLGRLVGAEGPESSISSARQHPQLPDSPPPPYLLHTARCTLPNHCGSRETEHPVAWQAHSDFQRSGLLVWCIRNEFHSSGREITAPGARRKGRPC